LSQEPQHLGPNAGERPSTDRSEGEPGAPLLTEAPDAGAAVQRPQVLGWSRVVPLPRWFLFMLVGWWPFQLYWFYNTWRLIAVHRRVRLRPLLRSIFLVFFIADFYRGVFDLARERGYPERPPLLPLSLAFVGFSLAPFLGGAVGLLGIVTFVLLLPAAEALNFFWASVEEGQPVHRGVNPLELVLVAVGAGLWALMLYAGPPIPFPTAK
jgi:hypothetical protein